MKYIKKIWHVILNAILNFLFVYKPDRKQMIADTEAQGTPIKLFEQGETRIALRRNQLTASSSIDMKAVAEALEQWKNAIAFFETACDEDMIEFAIYDMEAAKRKYLFLLKHSRLKETV
jgi:hypothetical protein